MPTSEPSIYILDYEQNSYYKTFSEIAARKRLGEVQYSNFYYRTQHLNGTCQEWEDFRTGALNLPFDFLYISSITLSMDNNAAANAAAVAVQCNDQRFVSKFVKSLKERRNFVGSCGDHVWRIFKCNYMTTFCVDCEEGCKTCPAQNNLIIPCQTCKSHAISYAVLNMQTDVFIFYPRFYSIMPEAGDDQYSIKLNLNITREGTVYCGAFENLNQISSVYSVVKKGWSYVKLNEPDGNFTGNFTMDIRNLIPSTSYKIACYTQDFKGHYMPIAEVKEAAVAFTTPCCKTIFLDSTFDSISAQNNDLVTPATPVWKFHLDRPSQTQEVSITAKTCQAGSQKAPPVIHYVEVSFTSTSSLSGEFKLTARNPGCFKVEIVARSYGAGDELYTPASFSFNVRGTSDPPPAPVIKDIHFSNDGRQLSVVFNSKTDKATINGAVAFDCTVIFNFHIVNPSMKCIWSSPFAITVQNVHSSLVVGSLVSLNAGVLQADCPPESDRSWKCGDRKYAVLQNVHILPPLAPLLPVSTFSTAKTIGACDDIIIDPTASRGSAGRPWKSIHWAVDSEYIRPENLTTLNHYLNTKYVTVNNIVVIPVAYLTPGSQVTVKLFLENFLLVKSQTSTTITITTDFGTPRVSIVGPSEINIYRKQDVQLFAKAEIPACAGAASQALVYSWKVFKGVDYVASLRSTYKLSAPSRDRKVV
jgi:hypothetical protein